MYTRLLQATIRRNCFKGKAIILAGARQTGKTTLAKQLVQDMGLVNQTRLFNCDNPTDRELLTNKDIEFLTQLVGRAKVIIIDEGQKVSTIGQTTKLLVDYYKTKVQVVVTGSSSFHLLRGTEEALTGRKFVYTLFSLSLEEISQSIDPLTMAKQLDQWLVYGLYPDVVQQSSFEDKKEVLRNLTSSYLYKDIFEFYQIKHPDVLVHLLKALALQVGSEVSTTELASLIGIDKKTVERYLNLLEQSFIIFRLAPYHLNKRREITKLKKVFFYDIGIRNAIMNNFNFLPDRNDVGALWENFLIVERLKYQAYHHIASSNYFWRTYDGSEVDWVEERDGKVFGYEFKWNPNKPVRPPLAWNNHPSASYQVISKRTLNGFIL